MRCFRFVTISVETRTALYAYTMISKEFANLSYYANRRCRKNNRYSSFVTDLFYGCVESISNELNRNLYEKVDGRKRNVFFVYTYIPTAQILGPYSFCVFFLFCLILHLHFAQILYLIVGRACRCRAAG